MRDKHLFIIPPEVRSASSVEVVEHTCACLRELGLYRLPYPEVTVRLMADGLVIWRDPATGEQNVNAPLGPSVWLDISIGDQPGLPPRIVIIDTRSRFAEDVTADTIRLGCDPETIRHQTADFLVALLATRNVVKTTTEDKLAKLGIGTKKDRRFRYTTTIAMPAEVDLEDDSEHPPTGEKRAPHIRRGHIRRQHYGPGNQFVRPRWIEPVFVNCDPTFVSTREAYNVLRPAIRRVPQGDLVG